MRQTRLLPVLARHAELTSIDRDTDLRHAGLPWRDEKLSRCLDRARSEWSRARNRYAQLLVGSHDPTHARGRPRRRVRLRAALVQRPEYAAEPRGLPLPDRRVPAARPRRQTRQARV